MISHCILYYDWVKTPNFNLSNVIYGEFDNFTLEIEIARIAPEKSFTRALRSRIVFVKFDS